ncbi:YitT family protein [Priestia koreensis]|uniref:YitT family protein n=1 Tax=Priestia koreensis TaxID=284581 RepID=UPI001F59E852|nr:YitT family protein [Priestia koreensis]UNL83627.1 YitT family protein [Priestia koreensis]
MLRFFSVTVGSLIIAVAYNWFLIPHNILSSGISGIAMIIGILSPLDTGLMNFLLNLPLLIIGYIKLGRDFILYSILSVVVLSIALYVIPIQAVAHDVIISSVFGGVLTGIGVGIVLRSSACTGGFDIVSLLLTMKRDMPIGTILSAMNGIVVIISGFFLGWDAALYTLVSIFVTGKVVDAVHTRHIKLTLMIITSKGEDMKQRLLDSVYRGITVMDGEGAYSKTERKILMTVISRYELTNIKGLIQDVDPQAFVNITETVEVVGLFHRG